MDAVVTDGKGWRVPNLGPEDFEILQDGRPQKITHFAYVPQPSPALEAPKLLGAPAPLARAQVRRTVALVVDDRNLSFANLVRARDGVRTYVERHMQPGDLVALVRTGGGVALLEQFTHDKRLLLEAVDLLKWRFPARYGMIPLDPLPPGMNPEWSLPGAGPEVLDYAYSFPVLGSLGALMEVVRGMRGMPGRKSVVFLCDHLPMLSDITEAVDRLTDLANRSAVSAYTIDPGGLRPPGWIHQFDPRQPAVAGAEREPVARRPLELQPEFPEQEGLTDLVWQDLTSNITLLRQALECVAPVQAGTRVYDAVTLVARSKLRPQSGRKTMIVISDGLDHGSRADLETAARAAQQADTVVYGIHYQNYDATRLEGGGHRVLQKLSRPTGGQSFRVSGKLPLEKVFDTIREEMRSQYAIGYRPPSPADGRFHRLEVKTTKPGLTVHAREGYYAIPRS